ncbi:MAG: hypothetical protein IT337_04955 [Thermomicrobiales bacterium]|nr:hypothetical protein [Thermomicrobiales bacterium]
MMRAAYDSDRIAPAVAILAIQHRRGAGSALPRIIAPRPLDRLRPRP